MKKISKNSTDHRFFTLAFSNQVVPRAIKVALLVGTILALINHADKILTMSLNMQSIFQIAFTYLVPYSVSTWSAVRALQANSPNQRFGPIVKTPVDEVEAQGTQGHPQRWGSKNSNSRKNTGSLNKK